MTVDVDPSAPLAPGPVSASINLTTVAECGEVAAGEDKEILLLGTIKCPALITDENSRRAPIKVSAVIDRSGSMEGDKLQLVKQTLQFVLSNLRPSDSFGVISYDDHIKEEFKLRTLEGEGMSRAREAVDGIHTAGCTNLSGGLFAGIDQMSGKLIDPSNYSSVPSTGVFSGVAHMELIIGNLHEIVEDAELDKHKWTMYVKSNESSHQGAVIGDIIESVTFKLHHSLPDNVVKVDQPPFEHSRRGSAFFEVQVTVQITPQYNGSVHTFNHTLNFSQPNTKTVNFITITDPASFIAHGPMQNAMPIMQQQVQAPMFQQQMQAPMPQFQQMQQQVVPTFVQQQVVQAPPSPPVAAAAAAAAAEDDMEVDADLPPPPPATNPSAGNTVNCVWLFTDGLANAGVTDPAEMQRQAAQRLRLMPDPCTVYTFGFGTDHNAALLKGLADTGAGTYYFIEGTESIAEAFADCLGGLVSVVAQDLSLRVEGMNGCTIGKALTAFPHEFGGTTTVAGAAGAAAAAGATVQQHANCTIRVRDMCSEEQRDIAVTLRVPRLSAPSLDAVVVARWTLTYRNMLSEKSEAVVGESRLGRPGQVTGSQVAPLVLDRQRNRMLCTEALAEARRLGDANQLPQARQILQDAIDRICASPTSTDTLSVGLVADLRKCLGEMQDRRQYASAGVKWMAQMSSNHEQQRGGQSCYSNAMKSKMVFSSKR